MHISLRTTWSSARALIVVAEVEVDADSMMGQIMYET